MPRLPVTFFLLLCVLTVAVPALADTTVHSSMAGNALCGDYLKARAERRTNSFELWLSGYLTGLATYDKRVNRPEKMTAALGDTGTLLLDSYCKIHPLATFQEAAREMARTVCYGDARRKN